MENPAQDLESDETADLTPPPEPLPNLPWECRQRLGNFQEFGMVVAGTIMILVGIQPVDLHTFPWWGWAIFHFGLSLPGALMAYFGLHFGIFKRARLRLDQSGVTEFGAFRNTFLPWEDFEGYRYFQSQTWRTINAGRTSREVRVITPYLGLVSRSKLASLQRDGLDRRLAIGEGHDLKITIRIDQLQGDDEDTLVQLLDRSWKEHALERNANTGSTEDPPSSFPGKSQDEPFSSLAGILLNSLWVSSFWGAFLGLTHFLLGFPFIFPALVSAFSTLLTFYRRLNFRIKPPLRAWAALLLAYQHTLAWLIAATWFHGPVSFWNDPKFLSYTAGFATIGFTSAWLVGGFDSATGNTPDVTSGE